MPRVTVYVPDDLKARMDEIGESANWSGLAQRAFREAVLTHATRKEPSNMTNVIERLRASKERFEETEETKGRKKGDLWARHVAEYDSLLKIVTAVASDEDLTPANLKALIDPHHEMTYIQFWHRIADVEPGVEVSDAFAEGFGYGAMDVYEEVKDQL